MLNNFMNDECGAILSSEYILIMTIVVLGTIVGLSEVAVAVNTELNDISNALGALRQTYKFTGFRANDCGLKQKSSFDGTTWTDDTDDCDENLTCDLVSGADASTTDEQP